MTRLHSRAAIFPTIDGSEFDALASGMSKHDLAVAKQIAEHGAVYCIGAARGGPVKIGWSSDIHRRLREFQTANHRQLRLLSFFPGDRNVERGIHETFSELRTMGEWFEDTDGEITVVFDEMLRNFRAGRFVL